MYTMVLFVEILKKCKGKKLLELIARSEDTRSIYKN